MKAPGYREGSINLGVKLSRGIDYEDTIPANDSSPLSPSPPR